MEVDNISRPSIIASRVHPLVRRVSLACFAFRLNRRRQPIAELADLG
jgi:hypothetical protein